MRPSSLRAECAGARANLRPPRAAEVTDRAIERTSECERLRSKALPVCVCVCAALCFAVRATLSLCALTHAHTQTLAHTHTRTRSQCCASSTRRSGLVSRSERGGGGSASLVHQSARTNRLSPAQAHVRQRLLSK